MSRIAGIFQRNRQPVNPAEFERALQLMARHPRRETILLAFPGESNPALGCVEFCERKSDLRLGETPQRPGNTEVPALSTVPSRAPSLSTIHDPRSAAVIAADARLDNRAELAGLLEIPPAELDATTDEVLILCAWRKWGAECPRFLLGDFAFAIWDAERRRLCCARDHLGIRPFYYHLCADAFYFASEIKFLLQFPRVSGKLNPGRVADYLLRCFEIKDETFYREIRRLPAGHVLIVDAEHVRLERWFAFDPGRRENLDKPAAAEQFLALLTAAVKPRAAESAAPAYLLSGGVDSSSIVALAHQCAPGHLNVFSATFPDFPAIDEEAFIKIMTAKFGLNCCLQPVDRLHPLGAIDEMYQALDEPFYTPNLYVYWELCKLARDKGAQVLIDGVDGDTTVSHGMRLLTDYFRQGRLLQFARETRRGARRFHAAWLNFMLYYGPYQGWLLPLLNNIQCRVSPPPRLPGFFRPALITYLRQAGRYEPHRQAFLLPKNLRDEHLRSVQSGLLGVYLEANDQTAAAFGLAHAHPYYNRRLMEFCLALPPELRFQLGWDRLIQRHALRSLLPAEIVNRIHKSVWTECFLAAFTTRSRERVLALLNRPRHPLNEWVDTQAILRLYQKNQHSKPCERELINVWTAVTLGLWLEKVNR